LSAKPLSHFSQVSGHGKAFEGYSAAIVSNSFSGYIIDMLDLNDVAQLMESMGIATNHKLVLKAIFAGWKKNPNVAFEALTSAKVAPITPACCNSSFERRLLSPRKLRRRLLPRRRRCAMGWLL
jgi:hypothetical protein